MRVRIKEGKKHGAFNQYRGGDELEVTVAEMLSFGDKFTIIKDELDAASDPSLVSRGEFLERVTFDASSMTITEVLRAVKADEVSVKIALESERGGRSRKTLITKLIAMV